MQAKNERLYGLDWLRIGALGLLIVYHIGMYFVPWDWHVKTAQPLEWLELPMLAVNPWRLALLFLISGVASRTLLARMVAPGRFASTRSWRLLLPLAAGMILFVAPQPWAELRANQIYAKDFWSFWTNEYFRVGELGGLMLPTWNHLWFVAYLWAYTMILALLACVPARMRAVLQQGFDRVFGGWRLFVLPVLLLAGARMLLFPIFGETHMLVNDVYAHVVYGFAFFFGVGLARSNSLWDSIVRNWKKALSAALAAYTLFAILHLTIVGEAGSFEIFIMRLCRAIHAWGAIVALLGVARIYLNRDGSVRRYLTDAIFPYYIIHQTIIVLMGYALAEAGLTAGLEFAVILAATLAGCAAFYEVGRRIGWLRPFIGLKPMERARDEAGRVALPI